MTGGSVTSYVTLDVLMVVAGVCVVDSYQNSEDIENFELQNFFNFFLKNA